MAFRKVAVPARGPLDDYAISVGGSDESTGYIEHSRPTHIAGGFTQKDSRYFLIAKYEVTELQYAALFDAACAEPSMKLRLPKTQVNWYEAVDFTNRYNLWLREKAMAKIPVEDGAPGFVRLPTETEWEFAARGGLSVSPSEFQDRLFPMPDGLPKYVWFAGSASANGKAQPAGLHQPNPLGLHDMLGNAEEIVLEPFQLNKLDRLHGQAGSFTVRGCSFLTAQADIRSACRQEAPFYDGAAPRRAKTTGFRVALVAPALTSVARIQSIRKDWGALGSAAAGAKAPTGTSALGDEALKDPLAEMQAISDAATDENMKKRLADLRGVLRANLQARDEQRDRAAKSALRLGSFLCIKLRDDGTYLDDRRKTFEKLCDGGAKVSPACDGLKAQLPEIEKALNLNQQYYADTIVGSSQNYSGPVLDQQLGVLKQEVTARGLSSIADFAKVHSRHVGGYAADGKISRQTWLNDCKAGK
ncbi:MAG: formylglycine-generating enzyme family protein [Panacagrimonas sp.]